MSKAKSGSKLQTQPAAKPDVAHPNTSAPSDTSRPIITHRPMMKDPMMVAKADTNRRSRRKTGCRSNGPPS